MFGPFVTGFQAMVSEGQLTLRFTLLVLSVASTLGCYSLSYGA